MKFLFLAACVLLLGIAALAQAPPAPDTPGLSLRLLEVSRTPTQGHTVVRYRLYLRGAAFGAKFDLTQWTSVEPRSRKVLSGITLDPTGLAICAGRPGTCGTAQHPNHPVELAVTAALGEMVRFTLTSPDGKSHAMAIAVPFQVAGNDRGCRIEILRYGPLANALAIRGTGFGAGAKLEVKLDSAGEIHSNPANADAKGTYTSAVAPAVQGVASGTFRISIAGPACSPSASIAWGAGSYKLQ
ncbi:MAG: hypothetical protein ACRD2D_12900 [Terriglobales bacterium]